MSVIFDIIKYGKIMGDKSYSPGISGNISARLENNTFLITSSGSSSGFLDENDFSIIDGNGNFISGNNKPSSERQLHLSYYMKRNDFNFIIHCHSPFLTAIASSNFSLDEMVSPEIIYCFSKIPKVEYYMPGSEDLVKNVSIYFKDNDVVLLANHGVILGSDSMKSAYLKLELLEEYAKTIIFTNMLGGANILPEEEVKKIYSLKRGN